MSSRNRESIQVSAAAVASAARIQHAFHCAAIELHAVQCRLAFALRGFEPSKKGDLVDWLHGRAQALDTGLRDARKALEAEALEDALAGYAEQLE